MPTLRSSSRRVGATGLRPRRHATQSKGRKAATRSGRHTTRLPAMTRRVRRGRPEFTNSSDRYGIPLLQPLKRTLPEAAENSPAHSGFARRAAVNNRFLEAIIMAQTLIDELDKVAQLLETAIKTETSKAKEREAMRKKALSQLVNAKRSYGERCKKGKAIMRQIAADFDKAVSIAEHDLPRGHPLVAHLNDAIVKLKAVPFDTDYAQLDKAIDAIEDWDVAYEKDDLPKKAIQFVQAAKADSAKRSSNYNKAKDAHEKLLPAIKSDLERVEDADVKKQLKTLLDKYLK